MSTLKHAINAEKVKGITIRFELRTHKADKDGKAPIRLVFQIKGQRKYHSPGQSILSQNWEVKNQQAIFVDKMTAKKLYPTIKYELFLTDIQVKEFNGGLLDLIKATKEVTDRFILDRLIYSSEMVLQKLRENETNSTKKTEATNLLFDFIDKYISDNKNSREPGSLSVYRAMKNHLQAYQLKSKHKITFDKIDYAFFQSFQNFLIGRTKMVDGEIAPMLNNTTIAKQLSTLKTFLNYAKAHGIKVPDTYRNFKIAKDKLEVIALTNEEFETLYYFDLVKNKRLAQVRDIFCFSCVTGFRYSDMNQLKWEHIRTEEIKLTVIKTGEIVSVPLSPYSKAILAKYKGRAKPLPMISNQRLNDYVKELCMLAGINEPIEIVRHHGVKREAITYPKHELIGVHNGRKTFATLSLEKGMEISVKGYHHFGAKGTTLFEAQKRVKISLFFFFLVILLLVQFYVH